MKEGFCERDHYTLQEAKDQLQSLLTEMMMNDAGYILDKTIHESKKEMAQLKKIKIRLDNYNSIASSKREHKDRVARTLEFAKKTLIPTLQEELCNPTESEGEESIYNHSKKYLQNGTTHTERSQPIAIESSKCESFHLRYA